MHQVSCSLLAPPSSASSRDDLQSLANISLPQHFLFLNGFSGPMQLYVIGNHLLLHALTHTNTHVTTFSRSGVNSRIPSQTIQLVPHSEPRRILLPPEQVTASACSFDFSSCFVISVFFGHSHARTQRRDMRQHKREHVPST